jgi:hypothetical protein
MVDLRQRGGIAARAVEFGILTAASSDKVEAAYRRGDLIEKRKYLCRCRLTSGTLRLRVVVYVKYPIDHV